MLTESPSRHDDRRAVPPDLLIIESDAILPTLMSIAKITRALLGVELSTIGLHQGQDELLMALEGDKPVAVSALAEKLCVRPSTVSKMLDRLVVKRYVERMRSPSDARLTMIRATPAGLAVRDEIAVVWRRIETALAQKRSEGMRPDGARLRHFGAVEATLKARLARLR